MLDKKHLYDGYFYDRFIAPNQDKIYSKINKIIPEKSKVIDFGCGTGRLSFQLADKCMEIIAIDLSIKNINVAQSNLKNSGHKNISFRHGDYSVLDGKTNIEYDFSVISYVIHEMPEHSRIDTLKNLRLLSHRIILSDYIAPIPQNLYGGLTYIAEYLAGRDHFNNFKNYIKNGGIEYLAEKADLKIVKQIKNNNKSAHLALLE